MTKQSKSTVKYGPSDRPPLGAWIPMSIQHVFAMFGATILVPILTGLSPSTALFTAGTGTLIYILITQAKVPAFLGSSFAFIPALIAVSSSYGVAYAMGGAFASGVFYVIVALVIKKSGHGWIDKALSSGRDRKRDRGDRSFLGSDGDGNGDERRFRQLQPWCSSWRW